MTEVVLDASVVVDLLLGRAPLEAETALGGRALVSPAHVDAEVLSTLARLHRKGELADAEVVQALTDLATMPIWRVPVTHVQMLFAWALRHNVTAKDALYLALAEHRGTKVVTSDARLRRAVPQLTLGPEDAESG